MTTTPEQIDLWRSAPTETQRLEFKEAKTQFDNRKLYKYCVAIANEGGGQLLLGIADKPPRPVVGTAAFNNPVEMAEKLFEAVGFRVDIEEVQHRDGRILVFHIPPRPRGTAYHLDGAYLMRAGEELVPMSEDQLRRIFAEGGPDWLEEPSKQRLDAQQVVDLLDTQAFFELLGLPYPTSRDGVLERLTQEKLIDRESGGYSIRRMAAILLAKQLSAFDALIRKSTRMVVYSGMSKVETRLDRTFDGGYAVGFRDMVGQIMGQLPQSEVIEKGLRRERILVPEIAVRELVANALIHQDFTIGGMSVMIEIYADRLEISSPGDPLVPVDRFIDGYQARNERLAGFMRRFAICEEKSSGVDKVIQTIEAHQLPAPDFHQGFRRTEVVLWGPKSFEDMDSADRVRACYQHCCLLWVTKQRMTNQTLRERFQLPESKAESVSRTLRDAIADGKIRLAKPEQTSLRYRSYVPFWA